MNNFEFWLPIITVAGTVVAVVWILVRSTAAVTKAMGETIDVKVGAFEKVLTAKMGTIEGKMGTLEESLTAKMGTIEGKMGTLEQSLTAKMGTLEQSLTARMGTIDGKMGALEEVLTAKVSHIESVVAAGTAEHREWRERLEERDAVMQAEMDKTNKRLDDLLMHLLSRKD